MKVFILLCVLAFLHYTSSSNWAPAGFLNDAYGSGNRRPSRGNRQPSRGNNEPSRENSQPSSGNGQSSSGNGQSSSGNTELTHPNSPPFDENAQLRAIARWLRRFLSLLQPLGPIEFICVPERKKIFLQVDDGIMLTGTLRRHGEVELGGTYGYVSVVSHSSYNLDAVLELCGQGPGLNSAIKKKIQNAQYIGCFIEIDEEGQDNVGAMLEPGPIRQGYRAGFVQFFRPPVSEIAQGVLQTAGYERPDWLPRLP